MDDDTKQLIEKLDNFFDKKGMNTDDKILLLSDMKYFYQQCRLKDKEILDVIDDLEDLGEDDDILDYEDDLDDYDELDNEPQPQPQPQPRTQQPHAKPIVPNTQPQQPSPNTALKQQLGKPIGIKKPQVNINQGKIDKGDF